MGGTRNFRVQYILRRRVNTGGHRTLGCGASRAHRKDTGFPMRGGRGGTQGGRVLGAVGCHTDGNVEGVSGRCASVRQRGSAWASWGSEYTERKDLILNSNVV